MESIETALFVRTILIPTAAEKVSGRTLEEEFGLKKIYTSHTSSSDNEFAAHLLSLEYCTVKGKLTFDWFYVLLRYYHFKLLWFLS